MTERIDVSTERQAPGERYDFWRQLCWEQGGVATAWQAEDAAAAFGAAAWIQPRGSVQRFSVRADAHGVNRRTREISRHPTGCYFIYRERGEGAHFEFADRNLTTHRGAMLIGDLDRPYFTHPVRGAGFHHDILYLPKAMLDIHLPARIGKVARPIPDRQGLDRLAASAFEALLREWNDIPETATTLAADSLCRLIGLALGADAGDHAEAVRGARLAQARRFIDANLADPQLSAARAAAALRISDRSLYALFECTGTTFAAQVRRRRLEECRAALIAFPSRAVMDVALCWGFGSMPSFYRAFHAAFGLSPGELREAAAKGAGAPSPAA